MIDLQRIKELARRQDWDALYALLDEARTNAVTDEDKKNEVHWRVAALDKQQRHEEALDLLRGSAHVYNSQSSVQHDIACLLLRLGREKEALDEISRAPFETEMKSHYALAIDAKFFYLYLLAKKGDPSVRMHLPEIPDDYQHITMDGSFLTKRDIVAELNGH